MASILFTISFALFFTPFMAGANTLATSKEPVKASASTPPMVVEPSPWLERWAAFSRSLGRSLVGKHGGKGKPHSPAHDNSKAIIDRHLKRSFGFAHQPMMRNETGISVHRLFWWHAARSKSLREFEESTFPLLPTDKHRTLFQHFKAHTATTQPAAFVDLPHYSALLRSALSRQAHLIAKIHGFYGSRWPKDKPIVIHPLPRPTRNGWWGATIVVDRIIYETTAAPSQKQILKDLPVIFHELAHGLYGSQPLTLKAELDRAFRRPPSLAGKKAYALIDEALATAIGNGWVTKSLTGRLPQESWYGDPAIDALARALYPEVEAYLARGQKIDAPFIKKAIASYRKIAGSELYSIATTFADCWLGISGNLSKVAIKAAIRQQFPTLKPRLQVSRPIDVPESLDSLEGALESHLPLVLVYSQPKEIAAIEQRLGLSLQDGQSPSATTVRDRHGRPIVAVRASSPEAFKVMLKVLSRQPAISRQIQRYSMGTK